MRGFTLIELLIVVCIIAGLVAFVIPVGLSFYESQQLEAQTQVLVQTLRRAQLKAISSQADSSFGVYMESNKFTMFKGQSYVARDDAQDEVFELPEIITLSGMPEVVFAKAEGRPSATGNITLDSGNETRTININEIGRINLEL